MPAEPILHTSPDGARLCCHTHGAHVTSWIPAPAGEERLFVSEKAEFGPGKAIRGGIPVVFPQFSGLGPLPKHGFARTMEWQLGQETASAVELHLGDTPETQRLWPHAFKADVVAQCSGPELRATLRIANTGAAPFSFTAALHTYLRVKSAEASIVEGLQGLNYLDQPSGRTLQEEAAAITFGSEVDRAYHGGGARTVVLKEPHRSVTATATGFPDVVVWNPGPVVGATIKDLETDGWQRFVCIEAAAVAQAVVLSPGMHWEGSQILHTT